MTLHLNITGIILILLALIHIDFPRYFKWKKELSTLSTMNRQMMYVHSFFIALIVLLMGVICLTSAGQLIETVLGKRICLGLGIFWAARFFIQFTGYPSSIWKGKPFETTIHILFSFIWGYFTVIFLLIGAR